VRDQVSRDVRFWLWSFWPWPRSIFGLGANRKIRAQSPRGARASRAVARGARSRLRSPPDRDQPLGARDSRTAPLDDRAPCSGADGRAEGTPERRSLGPSLLDPVQQSIELVGPEDR
jgi:hypothetical protein